MAQRTASAILSFSAVCR